MSTSLAANAQVLPEATNRRAILGAVLAASAVAALPASAAAQSLALSAIDRRAISLWRRRRKLYEIQERFEKKLDDAKAKKSPQERIVHWVRRSDECGYALDAVEDELDQLICASTLALAAGLIVAHHNGENSHLRPIFRAALTLVQPALTELIAEDADRVLARAEETA